MVLKLIHAYNLSVVKEKKLEEITADNWDYLAVGFDL